MNSEAPQGPARIDDLQIVENVSEGILVAQDGKFRYANPAALALTGYTAEEIAGIEFLPMVHPEDRAKVIDNHMRRLRGETLEPRYEFRVLTKTGDVKWVQLSAVMIDWGGRPATLSFISDITARRAADDALAASEARFRDFANATSDWFWESDEEHRYTWFSGTLERAVSRPPSHYLGRTRMEVAMAGGADIDAEPWTSHLQVLARREPFRNFLQERDTPAGRVTMSVNGVPRFDAAGRFLGYSGAVSNLTPLVESERRVRASEARYRSVVEGAPIGIVIVQDNRIRYANPEFARALRTTEERVLAWKTFLDYVHPEDAGRIATFAREAVQRPAGDLVRVGYRVIREDGTVLPVYVSAVQVEWEGRPATLAFVQDVSEHQRLEEDLKRSLGERELILENSVVGIAFLTPDGRVKWANRAMAQIFRDDNLQGRYGHSLEPNYESRESYIAIGAAVSKAVLAGKTFDTELRMRRADGTLFWVQLSGKAINAKDLSEGTVWVVHDIDRRKILEAELLRTTSEREAILQSTLVGITYSVKRVHQWVNRRFAEMMGWEPEELIGQSSLAHFSGTSSWEDFAQYVYPVLAQGKPYSAEQRVTRRDGSQFWGELHGVAVDPSDLSKGAIWTLVDISARKQAEEDIRAALEKQRELTQLKSTFVSMASHEFRTPLATILSSAQLLRRYGERLPESERGELYDTIETAVKRMTTMLEDILLIGKAESNRLEFKPGPLRLAPFCERVIAETRAAAGGRERHLLKLDAAGADAPVMLDEKLLRHILDNLLANAMKYSPDGGSVTLSVRLQEGAARFVVADEGIGMAKDDLPRLFEAFYRASNTGGISGTGLGLAIVKHCVDLHAGTIAVESDLGRGSRFTVSLPLA
jgi:PAS domain S-box-containing protein